MSLLVLPSGKLFAGTMGYAIWVSGLTDTRWHRVSSGMPVTNDHVAGIAWIPGRPGTLYLGTLGQGLFRSVDAGNHWTNASIGLPKSATTTIVLSVAYSPLRKTLYAGTIDGVYELSPAQ